MKITTESFYCDKCGMGNQTPTAPYLGWLFIETDVHGTIGSPPITIHLCGICANKVLNFIDGADYEG